MSDTTNQLSLPESEVEIRIANVNTDKTRTTNDSGTQYHVCFTSSQHPPQAWREIFAAQWSALDGTQTRPLPEAVVDGRFLFLNCSLREVKDTYLPMLKKAVAATNKGFKGFAREQATERERQQDVWKTEREAVDDMARSLHFEERHS